VPEGGPWTWCNVPFNSNVQNRLKPDDVNIQRTTLTGLS